VSATKTISEPPRLTEAELKAARHLQAEIEDLQKKLLEITAGNSSVVFQDRGISKKQAADLRSRLKTFAEDWERPEASIYDEDPAR